MRIEKDSIGEIEVSDDVLWGAQTQRSFNNFKIGTEKMPLEVIKALTRLKKRVRFLITNWENLQTKRRI